MSTWRSLGVAALVLGAGALTPAAAQNAADGGQADVHEGHRPDLPGEVRSVPSARFDRADVARDLRRVAAVGALDQEPRRDAPDAAVAHRQDGRHPGVQERSVAERRADRDDRQAGSIRARRRATRRTCRPPVKWPSEQGWNFASMFGQTEPDLIVKSTPWTQKAGANDAWWKPVVETGLTEAALGARHRDSARHREGPQDHPSRDRAPPAGRDPSARADRRQLGGRVPERRHVHGMGRRQAGRDDAAGHRQADAARRRSSSGTSTTPTAARTSPTSSSSASTSTRRVRSRSTARRCT